VLAHSTPSEFAPFIGPGFRSTSRLAGTPSHMMMGILQSNRDNVMNAIQQFRASLDEIESALQVENYSELEAILNQARESHTALTVDGRPITAMPTIHPSSFRIHPLTSPLTATVRVPGSKSLTNRALLIAALANGTTRLTNALFSDDSRYFANALKTLGFDVRLDEANHEMTVTGLGGKIPAKNAELFIGNAGTAARFLSAFLTLGNGKFILDGDARMRERPIGDLVDALTQLGANLETTNNCPPVKITASGLHGGKTKIAGDISSQFLSALLMVAPCAQSPIEIELITELNSKPYVDMTIAIMKDFGVEVERAGYQSFTIPLSTFHSPLATFPIESDASTASYFFAAPAICGGTVRVENISRKSVQGDVNFLDVLVQMGCVVTEADNSITVHRPSSIVGVDVDMRDIPDTAQTLAAIAPFAESPTRIRGIASARVKETDRVHATCTELARLGVRVEEARDGMTIYPVEKMCPAVIQTYNDHRMAMAFALIGLRFDGVTIENPSCVSKTFPTFFEVLETLR
jgi:3-phosphoshikimate 1-carboxyvinyltransferase